MIKKLSFLTLVLLGASLIGCNSEASATKQEEDSFRNPPKTPPEGFGPKGGPPAAASGN